MRNNKCCCSCRIELEKLKQKPWTLCVVSRVLFFLVNLVDYYFR